MAPRMDETPEDAILFSTAMKNFRASLSPEDRNQFQSYPDSRAMVADLMPRIKSVQQRHMGIALRKISSISELWQPYFDALGILVSAHPEYCAFFWGAIRLVFLVGQHYVTFFGKTLDFLDEISRTVSIKTEYLKQIGDWQKQGGKWNGTGLLTILGAIYYDAISFCQQIHQIFGSARKGLREKLRILNHTLWVPFDKQYAEILGRMKKHEVAFAEEMKLANTRISVSSHRLLKEYTKEAQTVQQRQHDLVQEQNIAAFRLEMESIQQWVGATEYRRTFENVRRDLTPGSCSWFLDTPAYQTWLGSGESVTGSESTTDPGVIMSVLGAPGYGKTVLSVVVLEDLHTRVQFMSNREMRERCVLHFHFHGSRTDENSVGLAFRSLLAQLLYQRQNDEELFNAALMLMYKMSGSQPIASEDQVDEVLALGLHSTSANFIVIDGVDECSDQISFFRRLRSIYNTYNCHIILFCRPTVVVPKTFSHNHIRHRLKRGENYEDIKSYLQPHIVEMMESRMLPYGHNVDHLVDQIAQRASSLFLWARLMVNYLGCIALTPRDRANAIENITSFQGLDNMFEKIVSLIRSQPLRQQETAFRVFQLLKVSYRPLTVGELETATAVHVGRTTCKELDYIVDFENSIVQICGALIEVCDDQRFDFVHSSIPEYLTNNVHECGMCTLKIIHAHALAANICLSYLVHDLNPSPLAGSRNTIPHSLVVEKALPLLKYASQHWSNHAARTLQLLGNVSNGENFDMKEPLLCLQSLIEAFMNKSNTICVWIEACYLFQSPPNLHTLLHAAGGLPRSKMGWFQGWQDLLRLGERISELTTDLSNLDREWAALLTSEPNEIWEASIRLFTTSQFWSIDGLGQKLTRYSTGEACFPRDQDGVSSGVLLITKVSAEGNNVASLTLWPSSAFTDKRSGFFAAARGGLFHRDMATISSFIQKVSREWSVRYQLKALDDSENLRMDVTISIPWEEMSLALCNSISNGKSNPGNINIACSISDDLRDISVMHSVFRVLEAEGNTNVGQKCMQILDFSAIRRAAAFWGNHTGLLAASFPTWSWTYFSPFGYHLIASDEDGRLLLFEEQPERSTSTMSWKCIAQTTFKGIYNPIFHPTAPLICLTTNNSTYLWPFKSLTARDLQELLPHVLENITFTQCGQYLEGYRRTGIELRAEAITLPLSSFLEACQSKVMPEDTDEATAIAVPISDSDQGRLQRSRVSDRGLSLGSGRVSREKLKQYTREAAIIWEHPTQQSRTVLRLPRSLATTNMDAIATLSGQDGSQISVYLDKAQQESYDLRTPAEQCFPMILKRQVDTLPISNLRLPPEQPVLIQTDESKLSNREEENANGDLSMTAKYARLIRNLEHRQTVRDFRASPECLHLIYDLDPSQASSVIFHRRGPMSAISFLSPSAKIGLKTRATRIRGVMDGTGVQGPHSTFKRRRAAPLFLEGPKASIPVSQGLVPHVQAEIRLQRDRFWIFNDFNWGILYGFLLGVFTSLIALSVVSLR